MANRIPASSANNPSARTDELIGGAVPVGTIVAWSNGAFTAANNGGSFSVVGSLSLPSNWKLCDGSQISDSNSLLNGLYVPKLDDSRFLQGFTSAGGLGGINSQTHDHGFSTSVSVNGSTAGAGAFFNPVPAFIHAHEMDHVHQWLYLSNDGFQMYYTYKNIDTTGNGQFTTITGVPNSDYTPFKRLVRTLSGSSGSVLDVEYANVNTKWFTSAALAQGGGIKTHTSNANFLAEQLNTDGPGNPQSPHSHSVNINAGISGTTNASASLENRPQYLNVRYIMRVK